MIPDSITFWSLCNAFRRLWISRRRSGHRIPKAQVIRKLFRQMLECHVLKVQAADPCSHRVVRDAVRVSTLNVALRLFMLSMDYPAAFVTLQTFRSLGLRPDTRSYRFIFTILLAHVKADLQPGQPWRNATWAVNFLGDAGRAGVQPEDIQPEVAYGLLEFARRGGDTMFRAPDLSVILGEEKGRKQAAWDIEPLERLMVRAILASMRLKGASEGQAERALREKLTPYFYKMVPDRLWKGRRLRKTGY